MANKKNKKQQSEKSVPGKPLAKKTTAKTFAIDYYSLGLGAVLLFVFLVRMRLLSMPFERDEGEYAYIGKLILHGGVPYRDAYNMKLPGTYVMYAFFIALFGSSPTAIHACLMFMSLGTIVLLFFAFKKMFTPNIALVAVLVYGLLALGRPFLGFAAHATQFINFYVALALFVYSKYMDKRKWYHAGLIGLLMGLAFLMKQQAVFFIVFGGAAILISEIFNRPLQWMNSLVRLLSYSVGVFIPYLLVLLVMKATGGFDKFWFWTVDYANKYAAGTTKWEDIKLLFGITFSRMYAEYPLLWILGLLGLVLVWLEDLSLSQKVFIFLFGVFSFAAVCPGFYFREHYFVVVLPALGLMVAVALDYLTRLVKALRENAIIKVLPFLLVALMGVYAVANNKYYYINGSIPMVSKTAYGNNPFIEAPVIAEYLKENTNDTDKIAIMGSEPEIYVYADRKSVSRYMYVYPLLELHKYNKDMQHEMMAEVERAKPKYIVYCGVPTSWLARPGSPTDILEWLNKYANENYETVGLVDLPDDGSPSLYYWGDAARRKPQFQNYVNILKRKGS